MTTAYVPSPATLREARSRYDDLIDLFEQPTADMLKAAGVATGSYEFSDEALDWMVEELVVKAANNGSGVATLSASASGIDVPDDADPSPRCFAALIVLFWLAILCEGRNAEGPGFDQSLDASMVPASQGASFDLLFDTFIPIAGGSPGVRTVLRKVCSSLPRMTQAYPDKAAEILALIP
jgi:hypothetical protein